MQNALFDVTNFHTIGGASLAVILIVDFVEDWPILNRIPTKLLAVCVAHAVLLLTNVSFPSTVVGWVTLLLNSLLVASAAIGSRHLILRVPSTHPGK